MNLYSAEIQAHILVAVQISNEERYNRKHIDGYIRTSIETNEELQAKHAQGVQLVSEYMANTYYASKNARIDQLKGLDISQLVLDIYVGVAHCLRPVLFTSVVAQIAGRLHFSDKVEATTTVAELLAVLCNTDVFDITKTDKMASLMLVSNIPLSKELVTFIEESQYLPPMVCKPATLENNYSSGYLTHTDSLILGTGNHHDGDICLDVLNLMNSTALRLNTDFLDTVTEEPTFELDTQDKHEQWTEFKAKSAACYALLNQQSKTLYLTHKVDKRGRIYAQGYHISSQGNAYKKAMIELAHQEVVTGVP